MSGELCAWLSAKAAHVNFFDRERGGGRIFIFVASNERW
jgi:hypothetical protein